MAVLQNDEKNVKIEIELLNNHFLDFEPNRSSGENWIPFTFQIIYGKHQYCFNKAQNPTFSFLELETWMSRVQEQCKNHKSKKTFETIEFYTVDAYFEIDLYDVLEVDELGLDCWINMAELSMGELFGWDEGVRCVIFREDLLKFIQELEKEFHQILDKLPK